MSPSLKLSPPTALAPLEGIGSPPVLRAWARVGGMGLLCAPFLRVTKHGVHKGRLERQTLRHGPMLHSTQLLGTDPERVAAAAKLVAARGVDVIDLNFGCPAATVVKKGAGAAMLGDPGRIAAVVAAVREAVELPVIAKIRLGLEDPAESLEIAGAIAAAGADVLAVHARTLADRYRYPARWSWIARLVAEVPIPVFGNGDVWTVEDALRLQAETGCEAILLGRGALRNPWIFRQIEAVRAGRPRPEPTREDLHAFVRGLAYDLAADSHGARHHMGRVKEAVAHLGLLLDDRGTWRKSVLRSQTVEEMNARIDALKELREVRLRTGPPDLPSPSPH